MRKKMIYAAMMAVFLTTITWAGSGPDFREGEWEVTVETEMVGMPMKMPPMTYTQCMTKSDPIPQNNQQDQQCHVIDMKTQGNTVTWNMTCDGSAARMAGEGKITYEKDRMNGTMKMTAEGMQMITHFKGHYLGACQ